MPTKNQRKRSSSPSHTESLAPMYFNRGYRKRIIGKALLQPLNFYSAAGKVWKGALAVQIKKIYCTYLDSLLFSFKKMSKSFCLPAAGPTEES